MVLEANRAQPEPGVSIMRGKDGELPMVAMSISGEDSSGDLLRQEQRESFRYGLMTPFRGQTRTYSIKTLRSGAEHGFVEKIGDCNFKVISEYAFLTATIDRLYRSVYPGRATRNPELTTKRILQSLSHPRTILELILYGEEPVGYGIFPRLDIGGEPVLYSSRAILPEHIQEGLGTHILGRAIVQHRRESARRRPLHNGFLMTQRWESIKSLEGLKERDLVEKIQPIDEPFDEEGAKLLFIVHSQVRVNSRGIESTGRSRRELIEVGLNENLEIPKDGTRGSEIFHKIVNRPPEGAGVNLYDGDVVYVRFIIPEATEAEAISGK
ncbi:hypothetical protein HYW43_03095 [Candidatus Daviesbacteria bacterium]|nr:hypothetical protein [Candidatus Daviesbacteria bacterium]